MAIREINTEGPFDMRIPEGYEALDPGADLYKSKGFFEIGEILDIKGTRFKVHGIIPLEFHGIELGMVLKVVKQE